MYRPIFLESYAQGDTIKLTRFCELLTAVAILSAQVGEGGGHLPHMPQWYDAVVTRIHIKQDFIFSQCGTHIYVKFESSSQKTWFTEALIFMSKML